MSSTYNHEIWDDFEALESLSKHDSIPALAAATSTLHAGLAKGFRGPIVASIASRGDTDLPADLREAMDRFVKAVETVPHKYQQPAFQCLSDYNKPRPS